MKKSVKILIVVLCLIIIGLVTFIVVDKVININKNEGTKVEENNATIAEENSNSNSLSNDEVNVTKTENNNNNSISKNEVDTNKNIETDKANEAIREALKDKTWVTKNIISKYRPSYEEFVKESGYDEVMYNAIWELEQYFAKITSINGMPAYLVISKITSSAANTVTLVTYENGKVVCGTTQLEMDYSYVEADLNKNIVLIANDPTGDTDIYRIEGKNYKPILQIKCDDIDNDGYADYKYFNNDVECSEEEYMKYLEEYRNKYDFVTVTTKLTDENIDKYVK